MSLFRLIFPRTYHFMNAGRTVRGPGLPGAPVIYRTGGPHEFVVAHVDHEFDDELPLWVFQVTEGPASRLRLQVRAASTDVALFHANRLRSLQLQTGS